MDEVDALVVGAGVVGLAVARALALAGREVLVLEAADTFGTGTSSRNSEVIHAGIYYPPGSLKARLCVQGRRQLYAYCAERGVAHRQCGKLIVASHAGQHTQLHALAERARANGVGGVRWLSCAQALALEPELQCSAALWSPATGIVDSHALMLTLLGDLEHAGGWLARHAPVQALAVESGGRLRVQVGGAQPMALRARSVVNAAGLGAIDLCHCTQGLPAAWCPPRPQHWAKGNYFALSGVAPFSHLIYPVVSGDGDSLGVHLTLDLAGQARFGPDVQWQGHAGDLQVDVSRAERFQAAVRAYWPGLPEGALHPAYAGVRPKLTGPGEPAADFALHGPGQHGVAGLVNLLGIESPGLTSCLALADAVVDLLA